MRIFGQLNTANPAGDWRRLLQPYLFLTRLKFIFDAPPVFMVYWLTATRPKLTVLIYGSGKQLGNRKGEIGY